MNDSQQSDDAEQAEPRSEDSTAAEEQESPEKDDGLAEPSARDILLEDDGGELPSPDSVAADEDGAVEGDEEAVEEDEITVQVDPSASEDPDVELDETPRMDDLEEKSEEMELGAEEASRDEPVDLGETLDLDDEPGGSEEPSVAPDEGAPEAAADDAEAREGEVADDEENIPVADTAQLAESPVADEVAASPNSSPSLPEQPPDVKGSRETPDQQLQFRSGDRVGGRFTVERYLGSSGGGISYLCRQDESGSPVVIKVLAMPAPSGEVLERIRNKIRTASQIRAPNLANILGMGTTEEGNVFVAMEYLEGQSLSRGLAKQREKGREIEIVEVFHVMAHIVEGLEAIHERLVHGLLTPFNIYLTDDGQVQIQNLGVGEVSARYLHSQGKGPFRESIYVAPEVAADPNNLERGSDIYSLGMLAAELLSGGGLPRQKGQARDVAVRIADQYGEGIHRLVANSLAEEPSKRIASAAEFRMALDSAVEDVGVDPAEGLPDGGLPIQPAVEVRGDGDDDLFDIPGPETSEEDVPEEAEERYLVRKDGLDYGPFAKDEVLEQLYDDEIDEHTSVLDRATQERAPLGELDEFVEEVEEYIPIREERKRKERERREEIERKVKQGGKAVLVVGIVAGLAVLGAMSYYYFTRPDPKELPVGEAFVALDYKFLPPPKEFKTVSADEKVLEKIFNPHAEEDEIAKQVQQARATGGGGGGAATAGEGKPDDGEQGDKGSSENVNTVDMGKDRKNVDHLKDSEIRNIILKDFAALRRCVQKELSENPSFNGVTVKFYIRPNGSTGGVTLEEKQYLDQPVGRCLVREFRQMEFPAHSAISNRGVTYPLKIQR